MDMNTPKRVKTFSSYINNSPSVDNGQQNWSFQSPSPTTNIYESPVSENQNRRGRPRSEALTNLMIEGTISPSGIKCKICFRVFPREKSLAAHTRTHTGEKPYECDYPKCKKKFAQSGQLKTHMRLHTGERPFICSAFGCAMRFTHANRHCPDHPYDNLKRCDDFVIQSAPEQNVEVLRWLQKYREERTPTTAARKATKRSKQPQDNNDENEGTDYIESNTEFNENPHLFQGDHTPITPVNSYKSSRKGLMCELDLNAGMVSSSPLSTKTKFNQPKLIQWQEPLSQEEDTGDEEESEVLISSASSTFNPKKKWLRDAWQDDLAKPLDNEVTKNYQYSSQPIQKVDPNQMRPTVLMVANKDKAIPLIDNNYVTSFNNQSSSSSINMPNTTPPPLHCRHIAPPPEKPVETRNHWLGALALMQLAKKDDMQQLPDNYCENKDKSNEDTNSTQIQNYNLTFYDASEEISDYTYHQN